MKTKFTGRLLQHIVLPMLATTDSRDCQKLGRDGCEL
jgi:hypothetical protein